LVLAVSTTTWWAIGFAVAGAVVLVAATLLVTIIALARRIVRQAAAITLALDGAMRNTNALFELASMNHTIESITRGLRKLRGGGSQEDERGLLGRVASTVSRLAPGGGG
jgi:hypothetical protein